MFRFTIRELVLLTAVVGLALGWGVNHRRQQHDRQRQQHEHRKLVGTLTEQTKQIKYQDEHTQELIMRIDEIKQQVQQRAPLLAEELFPPTFMGVR